MSAVRWEEAEVVYGSANGWYQFPNEVVTQDRRGDRLAKNVESQTTEDQKCCHRRDLVVIKAFWHLEGHHAQWKCEILKFLKTNVEVPAQRILLPKRPMTETTAHGPPQKLLF